MKHRQVEHSSTAEEMLRINRSVNSRAENNFLVKVGTGSMLHTTTGWIKIMIFFNKHKKLICYLN
jgi:hypothetical protein